MTHITDLRRGNGEPIFEGPGGFEVDRSWWDKYTEKEKFEEVWLYVLLLNRIFTRDELWSLCDEFDVEPTLCVNPPMPAENYDHRIGNFLINPEHVSRKELLASVKRILKENHSELLTFNEAYSIYKKLRKVDQTVLSDFDLSIKVEKLKPFMTYAVLSESLLSIMIKLYRMRRDEVQRLIKQKKFKHHS